MYEKTQKGCCDVTRERFLAKHALDQSAQICVRVSLRAQNLSFLLANLYKALTHFTAVSALECNIQSAAGVLQKELKMPVDITEKLGMIVKEFQPPSAAPRQSRRQT